MSSPDKSCHLWPHCNSFLHHSHASSTPRLCSCIWQQNKQPLCHQPVTDPHWKQILQCCSPSDWQDCALFNNIANEIPHWCSSCALSSLGKPWLSKEALWSLSEAWSHGTRNQGKLQPLKKKTGAVAKERRCLMFLFRLPVHAVYDCCYMSTFDHVQNSVIISQKQHHQHRTLECPVLPSYRS